MTEIPSTMKAVVLTGHGELDKLVYHEEWPTPTPGPDEVLIRVHACGLNNTDVNSRTAWYSKGVSDATTGGALECADENDASWGGAAISFPRIQGADVCGTICAVGKDELNSLLNKRVMVEPWLRDWSDPNNFSKCGYLGSERDGGFAEYMKVDFRQIHAIDCDMTDVEIATFATSWLTAENMLNQAQVQEGDAVLITGASGGVGSALVQLAKRRKATVVAMASESKHPELEQFAPDAMIARDPKDLNSALKNAIGHDKVSVVADIVGGSSWSQLIGALARNGRYVCSGAIAGPIVELDLRTLYLQDLTFFGCTVVPHGTFANLVGYISRGEVTPIVAAAYPLSQLAAAQQKLIDKQHVGNIVASVSSETTK